MTTMRAPAGKIALGASPKAATPAGNASIPAPTMHLTTLKIWLGTVVLPFGITVFLVSGATGMARSTGLRVKEVRVGSG